jgi:hypothetical protein
MLAAAHAEHDPERPEEVCKEPALHGRECGNSQEASWQLNQDQLWLADG